MQKFQTESERARPVFLSRALGCLGRSGVRNGLVMRVWRSGRRFFGFPVSEQVCGVDKCQKCQKGQCKSRDDAVVHGTILGVDRVINV